MGMFRGGKIILQEQKQKLLQEFEKQLKLKK